MLKQHRLLYIAVALLASLAMTSCSQVQDINGRYKGIMSGLFGMVQMEVPLKISGEIATMDVPSARVRLQFKVRREGVRLVLYERTPDDGLTFNITNKGNTLVCNQCEDAGFPKHWERQL